MADVLALTEQFKAELPQMLEEHKAIVAALSRLVEVAKQEHKLEYAHLAEELMLHTQTEEEVLYPTATMIGEYLKLRLKR